ncbi:MAG TPA: AAA family ATPase [Candidatus Nanopelagicaceae bacterium]|jgi:dephospho-CoA kinase|nr:AAA family ATPase [Candidatus Nanopelagicaceae bacterium]
MKVIGFCGLAGSGKSTVLKAIKDLGIIITMGDVIRNEAKHRNISPSDENLGKIALELRKNYGQEIIAEKCVILIKKLESEVCFIDGLRSMAEVKVFRKYWKFPLIATIVDENIRYERLSNRKRPDDPNSLSEIQERDQREIRFGLNEVIENANYKINNNLLEVEVQQETRALIFKIIENY